MNVSCVDFLGGFAGSNLSATMPLRQF